MAITPYLLYEDVGGALKFLSKRLDFRRYGRAMSGNDGKLIHAAMKFRDDLIMMGCPGPKIQKPETTATSDPEPLHQRGQCGQAF